MADSILKLKVESSEYDAKLKKAAEGIRHLADVAHKSGGDLTGLEKAELDYIKALGDMETKSRSAAGKTRELESAFKELTVVYNELNDVEKADEGGKALAASLETLKQRAQEAKGQLDQASQSLNDTQQEGKGTSTIMEQLAQRFTINIDAMKLFNVGLQAAGAALDVAKDAFFASEATVDEWGRVMDSSKSLYEGFLTALNTGDISGYLSTINDIVTAARAAYDELDKLGSMKTIQAPQISAQQTENERLRMMIQTGRYIAPVDGRKASMAEGQQLTKTQIQTLERQLQNGMKTVVGLVGNEVKQTGKAIDAVYNRQAKELGMSVQEFRKGTSSWAEFSKKMAGYDAYKKWDAQARTQYARQGGQGSVDFDKSNPYADFKKWGTFRVDGERYNSLVQLIQQRDQQAAQAYGMQSQTYRAMNRAEGFTVSKLMGNGGKGGKGGSGGKTTTTTGIKDEFTGMEELVGLIPVAEQKVKDLQQQIRESWDEGEIEKLRENLKLAQAELDRLNGKAQDIDLNKLFPDMSKQKYNTGYAGSIQSKIDSARQDMAMGPLNIETVNSYIGIMKNALKDADFGTDIYNSLSESMKDATTMSTLLQELMKRGMDGADLSTVAENFKSALLDGDIPDDDIREYIEKLNEKIREAGGVELAYNDKTGEVSGKKEEKKNDEFKEFNQKAGAFISGLSSVSNGLKGLGLQLPEGVDQLIGAMSSVMQVIQGVQTIISVFSTSALVANTAAVNANTFALLARSFGFGLFANGGVVHAANGWAGTVPGTSYSGDNIPIMANAGEVVLTRAMAGNLASQLEGGGLGNLQLETRVDAEELIIMLNNNGKRRGLGRLING